MSYNEELAWTILIFQSENKSTVEQSHKASSGKSFINTVKP